MDVIRLDKVVSIIPNTPDAKGAGTEDRYRLQDVITCHGNLKKRSSGRRLESGEMTFDGVYDLWIWYSDEVFAVIKTDTRIEIDSVIYTIDSWEKIEEENFYIRLVLNRSNRTDLVV